jgi:hypothetical protein
VSRMVENLVLDCMHEVLPEGRLELEPAEIEMAKMLQRVASGVSYTSEVADPEAVRRLIGDIPELAIVQVSFPARAESMAIVL